MSDGLYEDPDFPPTAESLGPARDADAVKHEDVVWLRPHEILESTKYPEPTLFGDEETDNPGDVEQGKLGDCYLVGAMASVAVHPDDIVERLFVDDDFHETGKVSTNFYKNGEWETVTIDTRLPCDPATKLPVFAKNRDTNELWSALLEKAYAKLHGSYAKLNGGSVAETLVDLSGGVSQKIVLTDDSVKEQIASGALWKKLHRFLSFNYLMGASYSNKNAAAEEEASHGILQNHAYSVLMAVEVAGFKLLKVRNPWGQGEWTGDWSDNSETWTEHPEVRSALERNPLADFTLEPDGTFWISFDDFVNAYNKIYVCRVFGPKFKQFKVHGEWRGKTAAGGHKEMEDRDGDGDEAAAGAHKGWLQRQNGDPSWFNNPQYKVTASKNTEMFISLMQSDGRLAGRMPENKDASADADDEENLEEKQNEGGSSGAAGGRGNAPPKVDPQGPINHSIRFVVIRKPRNHHTRVWELDPSEIVADSDASSFTNKFPQREVTKGSIQVDPRFTYFVVPFTLQKGTKLSFCLRIFSQGNLDVVTVDDTHSLRFKGAFERLSSKSKSKNPTRGDSAGGPLLDSDRTFNAEWCQNPQYIVYLPPDRSAPTNLKIVLRRAGALPKATKGKKIPRLGIVVCKNKPPPSGAPVPKRKARKQIDKAALLSDRPLDGTAVLPGRPLPPKPQPNRRLSIDRDEWATLSYFEDEKESCLLLKDVTADFARDGLIVTPMMDTKDATCQYSLEFHADLPVEVQELEEGQMQSIAGRWGSKTAGGCHINLEQWLKNPVYMFRLLGQRPDRAKVSVTLSRPSADWKKQTLKDPVGSMLGFYITPMDLRTKKLVYQPGVTFQTDFVPMNEVSTPPGFYLEVLDETQTYAIVPCTYEPGKKGNFSIAASVSSNDDDYDGAPDIEFVLTKMSSSSSSSSSTSVAAPGAAAK